MGTGSDRWKYLFCAAAALIAFLATACGQKSGKEGVLESGGKKMVKAFDRDVLAYVSGEKITFEELKYTLETDDGEKHILLTSPSEESYLINYLNRRAVEKMFSMEAKKRGVAPPDIDEKLSLDRKFLLKFEYLVKVSKGVEVKDKEVNSRVPGRLEKIKLQELVLESREDAERCLKRLKEGEDFGALVEELSVGPASRKKGIMEFIWFYPHNGIFDREQSETLFDLKQGDYSPILYTPLGFGIYKLIDRQVLDETGKEIVKSSIRKSIQEELILNNIEKIFAAHDVWTIDDRRKPVEFYSIFEDWYLKKVPEEDVSKKVVARIDGVEVRFSDLLYADTMIPRRSPDMGKLDLFSHFQQILRKVVKSHVMAAEAEKEGFELSPYGAMELQMRGEKLTAKFFFENTMRKEVDYSETALRKYYDSNRSKYSPGRSAKIKYVYLANRQGADRVYDLLSEGKDFEKISMEISDSFPIGSGPSPGYINEDDIRADVSGEIFSLSIGEVSRPIAFRDGILIVKVYDRRTSKANDYENVKNAVENDYRRVKKQSFYVDLYNKLKDGYVFTMNEKEKPFFLEELKKMRSRLGEEQKMKRGMHH